MNGSDLQKLAIEMAGTIEVQNSQMVSDVLGSLFIFFFIYNYTFLIRSFNSLYLMQLMYIISFSVRSTSQLATKLSVSHLYLDSSTIQSCSVETNCGYVAQLVVMMVGLICQIIVGCYARSKRTQIHETDGKKYVVRRVYFGCYSIVKATSVPVFFIFMDSCFNLKNIWVAIVAGLMILIAFVLNFIIFKALTFLNIRSQVKLKVWLDLVESICLYVSVIFAYFGFSYNIKHLNLLIIFIMLVYSSVSWKIKDKSIFTELEYIEDNHLQNSDFAKISLHKKRENKLQLLFFIAQLIPYSVLVGYFDLKDETVKSSSVDSIILIIFSSMQFILIIIILILRCPLEAKLQFNSHMDYDVIPRMPKIRERTDNKKTFREQPDIIMVEFDEKDVPSEDNGYSYSKTDIKRNEGELTEIPPYHTPKKQR